LDVRDEALARSWLTRSVAAHFAAQPDFGELPVAHDRFRRHFDDGSRFLDRQSAEEAELDDAAFAIVDFRQRVQRLVERDELFAWRVADDQLLVELDAFRESASFLRVSRARVVDEDPPHDAGAHGKKMRAVVPCHILGVDQSKVGLVHERGRLQAVATVFARGMSPRNLMKLVVNERNQLLQRVLLAAAPSAEQVGRRNRVFGNTAILTPRSRVTAKEACPWCPSCFCGVGVIYRA
jgi:hypothetical protein